jgi:hypothetical protein
MTTGPSTRLATAAAVVGGAVEVDERAVVRLAAATVVVVAFAVVVDEADGRDVAVVAAPAAVGAGDVL